MSLTPELTGVAEQAANHLGLTDVVFCGKGAFKETFRSKSKEGNSIALKIVDRTKIDLVRTEREIDALKRCNSPRIAKLIDARDFKADDGRIFDVVLEEFLDGGSLEDRLKTASLTQQQIISLANGLILAVRDLHVLRLVHRDIKPANIMFRSGAPDPVLVDFGLVRDLSQTSLTASWLPRGPGTPLFAPPEQLNNEKALIDWRSDQFSVGVLLSLLLTNQHPYQQDPSNLNGAIHFTHERIGPTKEFRQKMEKLGLLALVRMVSAWPIQRYSHPDEILAILNP
jgi:serine/threonine protein kinase